MFNRQYTIFLKKHHAFFEEIKFKGTLTHFKECAHTFIVPFLEKLTSNTRI